MNLHTHADQADVAVANSRNVSFFTDLTAAKAMAQSNLTATVIQQSNDSVRDLFGLSGWSLGWNARANAVELGFSTARRSVSLSSDEADLSRAGLLALQLRSGGDE